MQLLELQAIISPPFWVYVFLHTHNIGSLSIESSSLSILYTGAAATGAAGPDARPPAAGPPGAGLRRGLVHQCLVLPLPPLVPCTHILLTYSTVIYSTFCWQFRAILSHYSLHIHAPLYCTPVLSHLSPSSSINLSKCLIACLLLSWCCLCSALLLLLSFSFIMNQ